jgi:hypothetical protein
MPLLLDRSILPFIRFILFSYPLFVKYFAKTAKLLFLGALIMIIGFLFKFPIGITTNRIKKWGELFRLLRWHR